MGALTQAPKHSTSDNVKRLSLVVSPTLIFNFSLIAFIIESEFLSQQGVVVQT